MMHNSADLSFITINAFISTYICPLNYCHSVVFISLPNVPNEPDFI